MTAEPDLSRAVADFHTAFNLALAVVFFPLLGPFGRLLRRLLPTRVDAADPALPRYLDAAALETPVVALGHATREALRLADLVQTMLEALAQGLERDDRVAIAGARRLDPVVEKLNAALGDYVAGIEPDSASEADEQRAQAILAFGLNMELAAGVLDRNLLAAVARKWRRGLAFATDTEAALARMIGRLQANLRLAASVLVTGDAAAARTLLEEKAWFRQEERAATAARFELLRGRRGAEEPAADAAATQVEMLSDLRRVNAFLVAGSAYKVLDREEDIEVRP